MKKRAVVFLVGLMGLLLLGFQAPAAHAQTCYPPSSSCSSSSSSESSSSSSSSIGGSETESSSAAAPAAPAAPSESGETLARTGSSSTLPLGGIAAGFIAGGALFVLIARKRRGASA